MAYSIFLGGVQIPVPPPKLQIKIKNNNKTLELINDGEVNIIRDAGLTEISFDILIPHARYPFAIYPDGFKDVTYFLTKFEQLKTDKEPFQFICSRTTPAGKLMFDTNIKVTLEDYTISEDASDGLDTTVKIKLKQYRVYGVKTVNVKVTESARTATVATQRPAETAPKQKTYTTKPGDSAFAIAKKYLGDGAKHKDVVSLNQSKIRTPGNIDAGKHFVLYE